MRKRSILSVALVMSMLLGTFASPSSALSAPEITETNGVVNIKMDNYVVKVNETGFRYGFYKPDGTVIADMQQDAGVCFGPEGGGSTVYPAVSAQYNGFSGDAADFTVTNSIGVQADVKMHLYDTYLKMEILPVPMSLTLDGVTNGESLKVLNNSTLTDHYTIEADVKLQKNSTDSAGLITHYNGNKNYHLFFIKQGTIGLYRMSGSVLGASFGTKSYSIATDTWYHLKMTVGDGRLQCYINGTQVYDITDTGVSAGTFVGSCGFRSYNQKAYADNIKVYDNSTAQSYYSNDFNNTSSAMLATEWSSPLGSTAFSLAAVPSPTTQDARYTIDARVGGLPHTYGLGDLGAYGNTDSSVRSTANLLGVNKVSPGQVADVETPPSHRYVSNFVIAPDRGFAMVMFETDDKRVTLQDNISMLGALYTTGVHSMYYFFGDTTQIYSDYKKVRNAEGYEDTKPRYSMFGVGWEAYGSLAWNVYQSSVIQTVSDFLDKGYKLTWGVVGSGFWVGDRAKKEGLTTSFGMWDNTYQAGRTDGLPNPRFPDPDSMKAFFKSKNIPLLLGLRINFKMPATYNGINYGGAYDPALDGPYTIQGLDNGYFLKNRDGSVFATDKLMIPNGGSWSSLCSFLNASDPSALQWYLNGVDQWGVDGFKEDTMTHVSLHDDSNYNKMMSPLTTDHNYLAIVRNASYSLPGDTLRANDFNYGEDSNRMPMNLAGFAASGQGNVYPDILGGTGGDFSNADYKMWFTREAWLDALSPSMSVGKPVWQMGDAAKEAAVKKAVTFHSTYAPYIYSAAVKNYETGYPYSYTPLYIAYPNDAQAQQLYSTSTQQWEWMYGESLLAAPIWGTNYATQQARDIYLPAGKWMDYETGKMYAGPTTLKNYSLPIDKTPVFVGGKGILVGEDQQNQGNYFAQVFPVAQKGTVYDYTCTDGSTKSTIAANMDGFNPATLTVTDTTTGKNVVFTSDATTHAVRFTYENGHNYTVTGGTSQGRLDSATLSCGPLTVGDSSAGLANIVVTKDDASTTTDLAGMSVTYTVGNDTILSASPDGVLTALKSGTTTLQATISNGGSTVQTNLAQVTVNDRSIQITSPAYDAVVYRPDVTITGTAQGVASLGAQMTNTDTGQTYAYQALQFQNNALQISYTGLPSGKYTCRISGKDASGATVVQKDWPVTLDLSQQNAYDEFDGYSNITWQAQDSTGTWTTDTANGVLNGQCPDSTSTLYVGDRSFSGTYAASTGMTMVSGRSGGLVFGFADTQNYLHLRLEQGTKMQLYRFASAGATLLKEVPFASVMGKAYQMEVDVSGSVIKAYVDGQLLLTYDLGAAIPTGKIGYRLYGMSASFDHILVQPDVNNGFVKTSYLGPDSQSLAPDILLEKPVGSSYQTEQKQFTGYAAQQPPANASGTVADMPIQVVYSYQTQTPATGTVTVQYLDQSGNTLAAEDTLTGEVGTSYSVAAKELDGYVLATTDGDTSGRYRDTPAAVVLHYRPAGDAYAQMTVGSGGALQATVQNAVAGNTYQIWVYQKLPNDVTGQVTDQYIWVPMTAGANNTFALSGGTADENGNYRISMIATDTVSGSVVSKSFDSPSSAPTNAVRIRKIYVGDKVMNGRETVNLDDSAQATQNIQIVADNATGYTLTYGAGDTKTNVPADSSGNAFPVSFVNLGVGTYTFTATATNAAGQKDTRTLTVTTYSTTGSGHATPVISGLSGGFTGNTLGLTLTGKDTANNPLKIGDGFQYRFRAGEPGRGISYSASSVSGPTGSVSIPAGKYGTYQVYATAAYGSSVAYDDAAMGYYDYTRPGGAVTVSSYTVKENGGADSSATDQTGTTGKTYSFNATVDGSKLTGGETARYSFWRCDASGWVLLKDWSPDATLSWTPAYAGKYIIQVRVQGSKAGSYESARNMTFDVTSATGLVTAKNVSQTLTVTGNKARQPVTLTTAATPSAGLLYRYQVQDPTLGLTLLNTYSPDNTFTWVPRKAGSYTVYVQVINQNSFGMYDAQTSQPVTIG